MNLQNKKAGIYIAEKNHYSLLNVILKSLAIHNCKITLFLCEGLKSSYNDGRNIVAVEIISQKRMLTSKQLTILNGLDFILLDQLYSFYELLSFSMLTLTPPQIMVVHNCNTWFNPSKPTGLKNYFKYLLEKKIKKRIKVFAVAGTNMQRYVKSNFGVEVSLVPFRYADFDGDKDVSPRYIPGEPLRICIPGTISERRNYIQLLEKLSCDFLKDKIIIDVLGKPVGEFGQLVIEKIKELINKGYNIIYYDKFIENVSFDRSVLLAHLLLSDFNNEYYTDNGQLEIYGQTKETGISLLMFNKAKVGILPSSFFQMEEIIDQTIFYSDEDELQAILLSMYSGKIDLNKYMAQAIHNAKTMDINSVSLELERAYLNAVKN